MPNKKGKTRIIAVIVIVLGILGGTAWWLQRLQASRRATSSSALIQTVPVRVGTISETISALGSFQPASKSEIASNGPGKVKEVRIKEGDLVRRGEVIIKLDSSDLEVKLKQAEANLLSAKSNLNKLLAGASEYELTQARSSYEQARIALEEAKAQLQRDKALFESGALARQQLESSENKKKTTEQQLLTAQQKLEDLRKGPSNEDIDAAKAQLAQAEANLASVRKELAGCTITAPIDGTVTTANVTPGDTFAQGAILATIADLTTMEAVVPINEIDAPRVKAGQKVFVTVDALPGQRFSGEVKSIAYESQVRDNIVTYQATIRIPNPGGVIKSGMTADVTIVLRSKENALIIPIDALHETGRDTMVLIPGEDERKATPKSVRVGLRNDTMAEIEEGLAEGDRVVISSGGIRFPTNWSGTESSTPRVQTGSTSSGGNRGEVTSSGRNEQAGPQTFMPGGFGVMPGGFGRR